MLETQILLNQIGNKIIIIIQLIITLHETVEFLIYNYLFCALINYIKLPQYLIPFLVHYPPLIKLHEFLIVKPFFRCMI